MTSRGTARFRCSLAPLGHSCSSFWYILSRIDKPVPWVAISCQGSDRLYLFKIPSSYLLLSNEFHCYPLELLKEAALPSRYLCHCLINGIDLTIVDTLFAPTLPTLWLFSATLNLYRLLSLPRWTFFLFLFHFLFSHAINLAKSCER